MTRIESALDLKRQIVNSYEQSSYATLPLMSSDPLLPPDADPEPSIPPRSVPPTTTPPVIPAIGTSTSATGLQSNVAASLSVLFLGIGGIVFLALEKRDAFVRFWAMQSLLFGASCLVLNIVVPIFLGILAHIIFFLVAIFWLLYWLVCLVILAVWLIMVVKAFNGKEWELPILGKIARQQLAKMPPV